ncbi:MAG: hypothetical protein GC179_30300 [Anaerolineaceae bacterium]|nr:hypothetical protein [Anaerolineaceae bacterium]
MYELDHMLNGKVSSQHHQELIQQAQYDHLARSVELNQRKHKITSPFRAIYAAILHIIWSI